jgi:hypothetical protein
MLAITVSPEVQPHRQKVIDFIFFIIIINLLRIKQGEINEKINHEKSNYFYC